MSLYSFKAFLSHVLDPNLHICTLTLIGSCLVLLGAYFHIYLRESLQIQNNIEYRRICRGLFIVTVLFYLAFLFLDNDPCIWILLVPFFVLRGGMAIVIAHEALETFVVSQAVALCMVLSIFMLFGVVFPHLVNLQLPRHVFLPYWMYFLESQSGMLIYFMLYLLVVELHWNTRRSDLYLCITLFLVFLLVLWHLYVKNTLGYKEASRTGTVFRFVTLITLLADTSRLW